jgi:hypothetical protein
MKKTILQSLIFAVLMVLGATAVNAAQYDTSYVCSGTQVTLTIQNTAGYTFNWLSENNTSLGLTSTYVVTGATTTVTGASPTRLIYKLVVDSTGGAGCSSDTFYKVVYALPAFQVAIDSGATFYCVGSLPTDVVLASNVTAAGTSNVPNLSTLPAYAVLSYAWTPGTSPSGTAGGSPVGQTYTIPGASFATAGPGSYPYGHTVNYNLGSYTLGTGASSGTCSFTGGVSVDVTPQPSIQNVNVTTTFQ